MSSPLTLRTSELTENPDRVSVEDIPPELITEALLALRDSSKYTTSTKWLVATWVCRRWREIALSSPLLWAKIHMGWTWPPEMLSTFIERSSHVDLDVHVDIGIPLRRDTRELLLAHAYRTQALHIAFFWEDESVEVQNLVDALGPRLTSLSLAHGQRDGVDMILRPSLSSLRSLCVHQCRARVDFCLHYLTHLELGSPWPTGYCRKKMMSCLCSLLNSCPNIETLTLIEMNHSLSGAEPTTQLSLLRKLRELKIRDDCQNLQTLIYVLPVPSGTSVILEGYTYNWDQWAGPYALFRELFFGEDSRMGHASAQHISDLSSERMVLTVGARYHIAQLAAFAKSTDICPRRTLSALPFGLDLERFPTILCRDTGVIVQCIKPTELELHAAPYIAKLLYARRRILEKCSSVQKLLLGGAFAATDSFDSLTDFIFDPDIEPPIPELRELTLCIGSLGELNMNAIRESVSARLAVNPKMGRLVICLPATCEDSNIPQECRLVESVTLQIRTGSCTVCSRKGRIWEHEVRTVFSIVPLVSS